MRDPPGAKAGLWEGSGGAHGDGGGSARRRITGARVPATRASLGPRHLAQDDQEDDVMLTAQAGRRRGTSGGVGRRSRGGPMRASPGFWSPGMDSWRSCEGSTGVREVWGSPAARNRKGGVGYRRRSSARFQRGKARGRGWKPREASWWQGGAAACLVRSWGAPEGRVHGGAEARYSGAERGSGARVWGGCRVGDEVQGVRGSQIKAGPGISACGPGARARRRFRAAGARGRKGEGGGRRS
jgi:hypothetical protein